jgi:hypothetical protein
MANKRIELVFDLDAKDVQLATDRTLTLTQQIRVLKQELAKGQLGQKEFEIVAAKVGDLEDNIAKASRRSADFATTLQLIPGPIGEIASKVNGAISLLKQFSGFSFKDLKFQFRETANDITQIIDGFFGLNKSTKEVSDSIEGISDANQNLSEAQANVSDTSANLSNSLTASAVATDKAKQSSSDLAAQQKILKDNQEFLTGGKRKYITATQLLTDAEKRQIPETEKNAGAFALKNGIVTKAELASRRAALAENQLTTATVGQTAASEGATGALVGQAAATETVTIASRAATFAVNALKIATGAIVLTALITGITFLFGALKELVTGAKAAEAENKRLSESFELLKNSIDGTQQAIQQQTKLLKTQAETAGASADTIAEIERKGLQKRIDANKKASDDILKETARVASNSILTEEDRTKKLQDLQNQSVENGKKLGQLQAEQRQFEADDEKRKADERRKRQEKSVSNATETAGRLKQIRDQELAEIEKGSKEAFITQLTEREKEEYAVNEKYLKLEALAIKYKKDTTELENARLKELSDLKKKYDQEDLDDNIKRINASIEQEESAQKVDIEKLKILLQEKRDLELQNAELTNEERFAIVSKYNKQFRDLDAKEREDKLVSDIAASRGNFDEQIRLLTEFQNEVVNSQQYNGEEQLRVINDTNEKILALQGERFQAQLTAAEVEFGLLFASDENYYNKTRALYDAEEERYRDLLKNKKIDQAQFDAFIKQSTEARISLDQQELNAKMANFQAVSQLFAAGAALVGEQTKAGKAFAIASATIDTYVAANQVISDKTVPTFLKIITAAGIIIKGLSNVKRISEVALPTPGGDAGGDTTQTTKPMGTINVNAQRRAQGGMVSGPGTETSDSIPAMLSNGEFVVNARSTRLFQPLLTAINGYGVNTPAFAAGGLVSQQAEAPRMDNTERIAEAIQVGMANQPIRTYVTAGDITNQQQFDRVIKSRSLI